MKTKRGMTFISWIVIAILCVAFIMFAPVMVNKVYELTKRFELPDNAEQNLLQHQQDQEQKSNAKKAFEAGQYNEATQGYQQLIDRDSNGKEVQTSLFEMAKSFYETDKKDKSMMYYRLYVDTSPGYNFKVKIAYQDLLSIYKEKGMGTETTALLNKFKETYPEREFEFNELSKNIPGDAK